MKYYTVKRIVHSNKGIKRIKVSRYACLNCGEIHRPLSGCYTEFIAPFMKNN